MKIKNETIQLSLDKLADIEARHKKIVEEQQRNCSHEDIAECSYESNMYVNDFPPKRICLHCGLTEEGWSFYVLKEQSGLTPRGITRDALNKLRVLV